MRLPCTGAAKLVQSTGDESDDTVMALLIVSDG
jgi:hypothetical protein